MTENRTCPDRSRLELLLAGSLQEAEQGPLMEHVEGCASCQKTLDVLASTSQEEQARQLADPPSPTEPALEQVMREALGEMTQAADTPLAGNDSWAFLAPPRQAGHLGRLGHYEVLELVGKGGFGLVFRAFDEKLHRVVAIKVLAPELAVSATARKRFVREAQAAAAVRNEHVIAIYEVADEQSPPYLVMEYVAGISLQDRLDRDGALELREVLRIGLQTAEGLASAHKQGLVHRDIKPGNILLENGVQRVKITDFGLARAVDDASLSQSGVIAGTPMYMSPEQAQGEALDHRSDLFSLGSVLYAMCTGRPPFRATATLAVLKRVCEEEPRPIREINPDVPEWMCDIVARLHAKKPEDRFPSAATVAELLGQHLAHLQQPAVAPRPPRVERPTAPPARKRSAWAWIVAVAVIGTALFQVVYWADRLGWISSPGSGVVQVSWQDQDLSVTLEGEGASHGPFQGGAGVAVGVSPGSYTLKVARGEKLLHSETLIVGNREHKEIHLPPFPPSLAEPPLVEAKATWTGHTFDVRWVTFMPDGQTPVSASNDGTVIVWDTKGKPARVIGQRGDTKFEAVATHRAIDHLITTSWDGKVKWWDRTTGALHREVKVHHGILTALGVSPDGKLLAAGGGLNGGDSDVRVWELPEGKERFVLNGHTEHVNAAEFSPDSKFLATVSHDKTVRVWNMGTGALHKVMSGELGNQESAAWSPSGDRLVTVGWDGLIRFWNPRSSTAIKLFSGEAPHIYCVKFSPDGKVLATSGSDNRIRLWDAESERPLAILVGHTYAVRSVAFSGDGRTLISGGKNMDNTVKVWDVSRWTAALPPTAVAPFNAARAREYQDAWARHLGIDVETTNSIGMKLRLIPPGKFTMGSSKEEIEPLLAIEEPTWKEHFESEAPQHGVTLTRPFCIGTHSVTVGQFRRFVTEKGYQTEGEKDGGVEHITPTGRKTDPGSSWQNPGFDQTDDHPVVGVTWNDARAFCDWLSAKEGRQYALPTEAQWEYACRAGTTTVFSFGDDSGTLGEYAWFGSHSEWKTHPVGQKRPNAWGLYDMHGNVRNWVSDWYAKDFYENSSAEDPTGPRLGIHRMLRGGAWADSPTTCRSATRVRVGPSRCFTDVGFRVVLVGDLKAKPSGKVP